MIYSEGVQQTRDEIGASPDEYTVVKVKKERIKVRQGPLIVKRRSISGNNAIYGHATHGIYGQDYYGSPDGMIWGSTTFGIWGSAEWGPIQDAFILGHPGAAILGTSRLGSSDIEWIWHSVVNPNDTFYEIFRNDTFEDSDDTTADWDTTNYKVDFDTDGEIVQSKVIAKNGVSYTGAKMTLTGTNKDNLTLYLSGNGGSNWEEVTNGTTHTFTNSGTQGIHFKMVAGSDTESTFPLSFPNEFGCAVTKVKIEYS